MGTIRLNFAFLSTQIELSSIFQPIPLLCTIGLLALVQKQNLLFFSRLVNKMKKIRMDITKKCVQFL